jgi:peptidoglycan-associated lipoprotein
MDQRRWVSRAAPGVVLLVLSFAACAKHPSPARLAPGAPPGTSGAGEMTPTADQGAAAGGDEMSGEAAKSGGFGGREAGGRARAAATTAPAAAGAKSGAGLEAQGGGGASGAGGVGPVQAGPPLRGTAGRPSPQDYVETAALRDIHFDFDRYEIRPEDEPTLDTNADWLKSNPGSMLLIEGHCDERGTNEYNLALGEHRAKATMKSLVARGIPPTRISIISYGEERPLCTEQTEGCWAKNRRSHFVVRPQ